MKKPAVAIQSSDSIRVAAAKMRDQKVGFLTVLENDHLVGVITDRDIVVRCVADHVPFRKCRVGDFMSCDVLRCYDTESVEQAAARMGDHQIRHLPVCNASETLVGVLSLDNIAEDYSELLAGETLGEIVEAR